METTHKVYFKDAKRMKEIKDGDVALMVTSPPYPMIEMWDDLFIRSSRAVKKAMNERDGMAAFESMHQKLDAVWQEVYRILKPGGIACINIGDATRTINGNFVLYPNHARILSAMVSIGFTPLPQILWRKQTNAPNKFMGSGMMPPGAYVTLEHEHVLILRKGSKREFPGADTKQHRRESAFFWEERNQWFSDVWMDLKGTTQKLKDNGARLRSAAYPFELPYRLITMFSVKDEVVLDPFLGTGTTMAAAMAAGRSSIGYELADAFLPDIHSRLDTIVPFANDRIESRLAAHIDFVQERLQTKGPFKHTNRYYDFPVITSQETQLILNGLLGVEKTGDTRFSATYSTEPQPEFIQKWEKGTVVKKTAGKTPGRPKGSRKPGRPKGSKNKKPGPPKPVQQTLLDF